GGDGGASHVDIGAFLQHLEERMGAPSGSEMGVGGDGGDGGGGGSGCGASAAASEPLWSDAAREADLALYHVVLAAWNKGQGIAAAPNTGSAAAAAAAAEGEENEDGNEDRNDARVRLADWQRAADRLAAARYALLHGWACGRLRALLASVALGQGAGGNVQNGQKSQNSQNGAGAAAAPDAAAAGASLLSQSAAVRTALLMAAFVEQPVAPKTWPRPATPHEDAVALACQVRKAATAAAGGGGSGSSGATATTTAAAAAAAEKEADVCPQHGAKVRFDPRSPHASACARRERAHAVLRCMRTLRVPPDDGSVRCELCGSIAVEPDEEELGGAV
ncbi:unnamed protein product, partial [Phaeothamnion confervicola]